MGGECQGRLLRVPRERGEGRRPDARARALPSQSSLMNCWMERWNFIPISMPRRGEARTDIVTLP